MLRHSASRRVWSVSKNRVSNRMRNPYHHQNEPCAIAGKTVLARFFDRHERSPLHGGDETSKGSSFRSEVNPERAMADVGRDMDSRFWQSLPLVSGVTGFVWRSKGVGSDEGLAARVGCELVQALRYCGMVGITVGGGNLWNPLLRCHRDSVIYAPSVGAVSATISLFLWAATASFVISAFVPTIVPSTVHATGLGLGCEPNLAIEVQG